MHTDEIKRLWKRYDSLLADAANYRSHVRECAQFCKPRKSDIDTKGNKGGKKHQKVYDGYAEEALDTFADGLQAGVVPTGGKHLTVKVKMPDGQEADQDAKEWAEHVTEVIHEAREGSNFTTEMHDAFIEIGYAGTCWMHVEEHATKPGRIVYSSRHINEYVIVENAEGIAETAFRVFEMTAEQINDKWPDHGCDEVSECLREGGDQKPDKEFEVLHAIYPRRNVNRRARLDATQKPYASVYALKTEDFHELEEGGYEEFPGGILRGSKSQDGPYGRSPAMKALSDIKQYNSMWRTTTRGGEQLMEPARLLPSQSAIGRMRSDPGHVGFYDPQKMYAAGGKGIITLNPTADPRFATELLALKEDAIDRAFSVPVFTMLQQLLDRSVDRTQMEIAEIKAEKLQRVGPLLGRQKFEFLDRIVEREFGILWRAGKIRQPPKSLKGAKLDIEWISPLFTAQRRNEKRKALLEGYAFADQRFAATQDPAVYDNIDDDKATDEFFDLCGFPADCKRGPDEVQQIRQARAQQAQQQQRMEQVQAAADAAHKMGATQGAMQ